MSSERPQTMPELVRHIAATRDLTLEQARHYIDTIRAQARDGSL